MLATHRGAVAARQLHSVAPPASRRRWRRWQRPGRRSPAPAPAPAAGSSEPAARSSYTNQQYGWRFDLDQQPAKPDPKVQDVPVASIRRPLAGTRSNDAAKVAALMASIQEIGLQEPIDVLLVDGVYYGFSGCHRFEAAQRLGLPTIKCRVRKANQQVLMMHLR